MTLVDALRGFALTAAIAAAVVFVACDSEQEPVAPETDTERAGETIESVDRLARAVALAMSDEDVRRGVLEDMRDSPFEGHRLHLNSYLGSPTGEDIVAEAVARSNLDEAELRSLVSSSSALEFFVISPVKRTLWTGGDDIAVTALPVENVDRPNAGDEWTAYSVSGDEVSIPAGRWTSTTIFGIYPASIDFGNQPEARRVTAKAAASDTRRNTIAARPDPARPETWRALADGMGGGGIGAPNGPAASSGSHGIDLGFTYNDCLVGANDFDQDALQDQCEFEIASAFAPTLYFHSDEKDAGREEAWIVESVTSPNSVLVGYLLSYYQDSGVQAAGGDWPWYQHPGDSEFIFLWLSNDQGTRWVLDHARFSAHFGVEDKGGVQFDHSYVYSYESIQYSGSYRGKPVSWVAHGKHANYPTWAHCFSGAPYDTCEQGFSEAVMVRPERNIGSDKQWGSYPVSALLDCSTSRFNPTTHPGIECYWTFIAEVTDYHPNTFNGWTDVDADVMGYPSILYYHSFKTDLHANPPENLETWDGGGSGGDPIDVTLTGPSWVPDYIDIPCSWQAITTGGDGGTVTYDWEWDYQPVQTMAADPSIYLGNTGPEGMVWLEVTVENANNTASDGMAIQVDSSTEFGDCL